MRRAVFLLKSVILALVFCSFGVASQAIDNYVPASSDKDTRPITGSNISAVFVHSACAANPDIPCDEQELSTCTPQTITAKGPNGESITTQTVCERVRVAKNPNKLFIVEGDCRANSPSLKTATCTSTNQNHAWSTSATWWTNVSMSVIPLLDKKEQPDWASQFCSGCTWEWVPASNSCATASSSSTGFNVAHNFSGNPTGNCQAVGIIKVRDPETNKSWDSSQITARLIPTPPNRTSLNVQYDVTPGAGSVLYSATGVQTQGNTASIILTSKLNGVGVAGWPSAPINCPQCVYSHIVSSNTCSSVSISGASTVASHPVTFSSSCSFVLRMRVTDPESLWSNTTAPITVQLRKTPQTCFDTSETQWVNASQSCQAGYLGGITYQNEQRRNFVCSGPYGPGNWTTWSNTGTTRNYVNTCEIECVPLAPETQWLNASASCPSGYLGSNTWQKEQRRTSSCPAATGSPTWSGWSDTGATRNVTNTCQPQCNALPDETQWIAASAACQSGYTGSHTWEKQQSRTSSCPTSTGSPIWSTWSDTGSTRNVSNTCQPVCTNSEQYQWVNASQACPSGYSGSHTWQKEQINRYTCGTGWSGWSDTGSTRNVSNTCTPPPTCPITAGTKIYQWSNRSAACPSGQTGTHTWQQQQVATYGSHPNCNYGAWQDTATTQNNVNTCKASTPQCAYKSVVKTVGSGANKQSISLDLLPVNYGSSYDSNGGCYGVGCGCGVNGGSEWEYVYLCNNGTWQETYWNYRCVF